MPERDADVDGPSRGLPRLPPGRHGLGREFVSKNQQDRLMAGIIEVVAGSGYRAATVAQICTAAGVSRRTFYSYFSSKEECYAEAFDSIGDFIEATLMEAGAEEADWPGQVRARLAALLEIFAANPALVSFAVIAPVRAGEAIAGRHRAALERILGVLTAGQARAENVRKPSSAVEHALGGGMVALIAAKVESGEGKRLPELLPDLVELFLTPYLGREAAAREAGRTG